MDKVITLLDFITNHKTKEEEFIFIILVGLDSSNLFLSKKKREILEIIHKHNPERIYDTKGDISLVTRLIRLHHRVQDARNKQEVFNQALLDAKGRICYDNRFEDLYNSFIVYPPGPKIDITDLHLGTEDYPNMFPRIFWEFFTDLRLVNILANSSKGRINQTILDEHRIPQEIKNLLPTYNGTTDDFISMNTIFPEAGDPDQVIFKHDEQTNHTSISTTAQPIDKKKQKGLTPGRRFKIFKASAFGKGIGNSPKLENLMKQLESIESRSPITRKNKLLSFTDDNSYWGGASIELSSLFYELIVSKKWIPEDHKDDPVLDTNVLMTEAHHYCCHTILPKKFSKKAFKQSVAKKAMEHRSRFRKLKIFQ